MEASLTLGSSPYTKGTEPLCACRGRSEPASEPEREPEVGPELEEQLQPRAKRQRPDEVKDPEH